MNLYVRVCPSFPVLYCTAHLRELVVPVISDGFRHGWLHSTSAMCYYLVQCTMYQGASLLVRYVVLGARLHLTIRVHRAGTSPEFPP